MLYDGFVEWMPYDENMNVIEFIAVDTTKVDFSIDVAIENDDSVVTALVVVRRGTKNRTKLNITAVRPGQWSREDLPLSAPTHTLCREREVYSTTGSTAR